LPPGRPLGSPIRLLVLYEGLVLRDNGLAVRGLYTAALLGVWLVLQGCIELGEAERLIPVRPLHVVPLVVLGDPAFLDPVS
tara:strand:+ start:1215 stop:1457 length:243 start_codon:yes stop_codon:yes gene_type:complete